MYIFDYWKVIVATLQIFDKDFLNKVIQFINL
ncbi:hypothetical protein Cri9333_2326 [Crinalium epipsammum PCC 9333]|uniref:Uncharacterized protein n=1 Tax=Crinalium epipsammum PCC 9333 TaxID=1173022 RepID=K9W188_9CYAN|nr:hypothetical protein Cri9333_2326 [Crinalium epipsammum PCC 9333]